MDFQVNSIDQIGPLLLGLRKHAGLTQSQVAQKIGTTQQAYAKVEADPSTTSVARLWSILQTIGGGMVLQLPDQAALNVFALVNTGVADTAADGKSSATSPGKSSTARSRAPRQASKQEKK